MIKKLLLGLIVTCTMISITKAQSAIIDAVKLSKLFSGDKLDLKHRVAFSKILAKYVTENDSPTPNAVKYAFRKNIFLNDLIPASITQSPDPNGSGVSITPPSFSTNIEAKSEGWNMTNIADGLAQFLVDRTKQELNAFFFDNFQAKVKEFEELQVLFPHTASMLEDIGQEIYHYNTYLKALREAFAQDLSGLFVNFPSLMDSEKYKEAFQAFPALRGMMKSAFYIVNQLNNNVHPGDILQTFPRYFGLDSVPRNVYSAIKIGNAISQALRSGVKGQYWVGNDTLSLLRNHRVLRIFLGLVHHQLDDISFKLPNDSLINFKNELHKLGKVWNTAEKDIVAYRDFIIGFGAQLEKVQVSLKAVKNDEKSPKDIYRFLTTSINMMKYVEKIGALPFIEGKIPEKTIQNYQNCLDITQEASYLYLNIYKEDYSSAIFNVLNIFDEMITDQVVAKVGALKMNKRLTAIAEEYANDPKKLAKEKSRLEDEKEAFLIKQKRIKKAIMKYGIFMASVVGAQSSAEVKEILSSIALPVGSSRIKRESAFNVAVNGYVGFFTGYEKIPAVRSKQWINNVSLSAPVGVSFSWGGLFRKAGKPGWSLGGFVSMVDLGSLVSYRFGDDSTSQLSNVTLKQIIAPGLFISCGIPKSPFSLSFGYQRTPLLREVSTTENTVLNNSGYRIGGTLTVDIPIINLYNREKDK